MQRRNQGFTLIEILVVITIIAALAGLVVALVPKLLNTSKEAQSLNNLKQIGGLLIAKDAETKLKKYSGAAFLLQVKGQIQDEDLKVFLSPADENFQETRPETGSQEFIDMYRNLEIPGTIEDKHTSYAGPNWKDFPQAKAGRAALKTRLWGCDRCYQGMPFHEGVVALFSTGKVEKIDIKNITGADLENEIIQVGSQSPDERLKKMCYFAP